MNQVQAPAADWYPDPSGRFQFRYWDGQAWSGHVATDGKTDWDAPGTPDAGGASDTEPAEERTDEDPSDANDVQPQEVDPSPADSDDNLSDDAMVTGAVETGAVVAGAVETSAVPGDVNGDANHTAELSAEVTEWLDEVAVQVPARLNRINSNWMDQPQSEAAPACAYGILLGHLARIHPHMRAELSQVAEAHPSFSTLESGGRLDTLQEIADDPRRAAAWLGPLIGVDDSDRVKMLFD